MLLVFGFNSAKYHIFLSHSFFLPILINGQDFEHVVNKNANQYISVKFGDIQFPDIMSFLGGATSPHSFLKAYETSETKRFFHYKQFVHPGQMQNTELLSYDMFYSKLRCCYPLEAVYTDYVNLVKSGMTTEQTVAKLKLTKPPPSEFENYQILKKKWLQELMNSFEDLLRG